METSTKMKLIALATTVGAAASNGVHATALIANDTLEGLPQLGTDVGDFMGNLAPGLFKFLLLIGLGVAIVGLIVGIIYVMKTKATHHVR